MQSNSKLKKNIDNFFDAFLSLHNFIKDNLQERIEGAILAICYIDSLSNHRRRSGGNKKKFIKFILEFADKSYKLVSLPLLIEDLENNQQVSNNIVSQIKSKLNISAFEFTKLRTSHDVEIEKLISKISKFITGEDLKKVRNIAEKYIYAVILWDQYRNNLIHLTKSKDNEAVNINDSTEPFYSVEISFDHPAEKHIRFAFPRTYIYETLYSCITNFRTFCHANGFDPYKS